MRPEFQTGAVLTPEEIRTIYQKINELIENNFPMDGEEVVVAWLIRDGDYHFDSLDELETDEPLKNVLKLFDENNIKWDIKFNNRYRIVVS